MFKITVSYLFITTERECINHANYKITNFKMNYDHMLLRVTQNAWTSLVNFKVIPVLCCLMTFLMPFFIFSCSKFSFTGLKRRYSWRDSWKKVNSKCKNNTLLFTAVNSKRVLIFKTCRQKGQKVTLVRHSISR